MVKNHTVILTNSSSKATIDSKEVELPDVVSVDSSKNYLISADSMQVLFGFTWKYNADQNELLLINPDSDN